MCMCALDLLCQIIRVANCILNSHEYFIPVTCRLSMGFKHSGNLVASFSLLHFSLLQQLTSLRVLLQICYVLRYGKAVGLTPVMS